MGYRQLVEMLLALGKAPLLRRGNGHFPLNFMFQAKKELIDAKVVKLATLDAGF